jgi:hypothetical protein
VPVKGAPEFFYSKAESEFTGAATYKGGIKISISSKTEGGGKSAAFFSLRGSISTDGKGVVTDYSVTAATGLSLSAKGSKVSIGGELTFDPAGERGSDWEIRDSDFSAGISKSYGNKFMENASASFEAFTKRGCTLSGKVEQSLEPVVEAIEEGKKEQIGADAGKLLPIKNLYKRDIWSGKFVIGSSADAKK